jgi:hypothetical protein
VFVKGDAFRTLRAIRLNNSSGAAQMTVSRLMARL